jgi:hypothetical protein
MYGRSLDHHPAVYLSFPMKTVRRMPLGLLTVGLMVNMFVALHMTPRTQRTSSISCSCNGRRDGFPRAAPPVPPALPGEEQAAGARVAPLNSRGRKRRAVTRMGEKHTPGIAALVPEQSSTTTLFRHRFITSSDLLIRIPLEATTLLRTFVENEHLSGCLQLTLEAHRPRHTMRWSGDSQRMLMVPNAGGSSLLSEVKTPPSFRSPPRCSSLLRRPHQSLCSVSTLFSAHHMHCRCSRSSCSPEHLARPFSGQKWS